MNIKREIFGALGCACLLAIPASGLADPAAYFQLGNDDFGVLNLTNGSYSILGTSQNLMAGLGFLGTTIYGGINGGDGLYTLNPTNGFETLVGTGAVNYAGDFGSTTTALYGLDGGGNLYSVDPLTGADTFIGNTGIGVFGLRGMSAGNANLYYAQEGNLYQLSTVTGAATLIGALTNSSEPGSMLFEDGVMYAGDDGTNPYSISAVNLSNGNGTYLFGLTGLPGAFWGLTPTTLVSTVPGPLAGLPFLAGLALLRRRSSR